MNIFCIDASPVTSARQLCDKHVVKMGVEACQMLACAFSLEDLKTAPKTKTGKHWKHLGRSHPCLTWTLARDTNFHWLLTHARHIFLEYTERYGKRHFTQDFLEWMYNNQDRIYYPIGNIDPLTFKNRAKFPIAIKDDKICRKVVDNFENLDRVSQYRAYYIHDKPFAKWKQNKPRWYT